MLTSTPTRIYEGQTYTGYDTILPMKAEKSVGCVAFISAAHQASGVLLSVNITTSFGEVSRQFAFNGNDCFCWEPLPGYSFVFLLSKFKKRHGRFRFRVWLQARADAPGFGLSWASYSFFMSSFASEFCTEKNNPAHLTRPNAAVKHNPAFSSRCRAVTHLKKRKQELVLAC